MEDLIFCKGCNKWFVIGNVATVFGTTTYNAIDPPEDKDHCKNCGRDITDETESYDTADIIELLEENNIVPKEVKNVR